MKFLLDFCSVLVGRAAMYDMLTVYAAYLAIVAGLGAPKPPSQPRYMEFAAVEVIVWK